MADQQATYSIAFEGDTKSVPNQMADELEKLRQKVDAERSSMRQLETAMRSLKGQSDEVVAAKSTLKAKVDAARNSISQANLAIVKQGTTYGALSDAVRKATAEQAKLEAAQEKAEAKKHQEEIKKIADSTKKMSDAIKTAGGPVAELTSRFNTFKELAEGSEGKLRLMTVASVAAIAGIVALGAAVVAATVSLGRFILQGADAARSMQLVRVAASGSEQNATALGHQVDALARKVPTAKTALNELAVAITKSLSGGTSRANGQVIVDTINAVAEASAGAGEESGNVLKGIIERSKTLGRIQLNPFELQGSRVKFGDIAEQLAKQTHVGVDQANIALRTGRVSLEAGAAAIRAAVEKEFGKINGAKLISLDTIAAKFQERLSGLTSGVNLEPLLQGLDRLSSLFDTTTVNGQSLKVLFTVLGNRIVTTFTDNLPTIENFLKTMTTLALVGGNALLTLAGWVQSAVSTFSQFVSVRDILTGIQEALGIAAAAAVVFAASTIEVWGPIALTVAGVAAAFYGVTKAVEFLQDVKWGEVGTAIINGIVGGLTGAYHFLVDSVTGIADRVKDAFKNALGIHSPSAVFADYGDQTARGYEQGMRRSSPIAQEAANALAPSAPRAGGGGAAGGATVNIDKLQLIVQGGSASQASVPVNDPSFRSQLTQALRDVLHQASVPTQTAVAV